MASSRAKTSGLPGAKGLSESGKAFLESAVRRLRAHSLRVTAPRVRVLRVLAEADQPLSAYRIHDQILEESGRVDVVSVYRTLSALAAIGLVHHIGTVDGYLPCRLEHRHDEEVEHLICTSCGKVTEVPLSSSASLAAHHQLEEIGFKPSTLRIEVVGLCGDCAALA